METASKRNVKAIDHEDMSLAQLERFLDEENAAAEILLADAAEANGAEPAGCTRECACCSVGPNAETLIIGYG